MISRTNLSVSFRYEGKYSAKSSRVSFDFLPRIGKATSSFAAPASAKVELSKSYAGESSVFSAIEVSEKFFRCISSFPTRNEKIVLLNNFPRSNAGKVQVSRTFETFSIDESYFVSLELPVS